MNAIQQKIKNYCDEKDNQNPFSYKIKNIIWAYGKKEPIISTVKKYGNPDFVPFLDGKSFKVE